MHVASEAGRHVLPAASWRGTSRHDCHVLDALPEQLASVIEAALILRTVTSYSREVVKGACQRVWVHMIHPVTPASCKTIMCCLSYCMSAC